MKLTSIHKLFTWSILFLASFSLFLIFSSLKTLSISNSSLEFKNVAEYAGITFNGEQNIVSVAWIDFNQDNFPDLWIAPHGFKKSPQSERPKLYLNQKNGTFTHVASSIFTSEIHGDHHGNSWADFDNDGDLETEDYESYSTLVKAVENILINFGTKYTINFA